MKKIVKYVILDILRSRIIIGYTLLLMALSFSVFNVETNSSKGILSLLNVILIIVPLVSIIFSTIYIYNASEFIELLVSQPLKRKSIWISQFAGLSLALSFSFLIGCGIPIMIFDGTDAGIMILLMGLFLSVIFVSLAMLSAVFTRDKAKGIGISILLWLFFSLLYDGLVLFLLFQFMDYPVEKGLVAMSMFNPVDLSRILILLKLDISALMGATSAIFNNFFGRTPGIVLAFTAMIMWILIPLGISIRKFNTKDL